MQQIYEWVVRVGNKDFFLTEKQHEKLLSSKNENAKMVVFKTFTINPAFVEYSFRQRANNTARVCPSCGGSGFTIVSTEGNVAKTEECRDCGGSGRVV